jgi:hypothetical protein
MNWINRSLWVGEEACSSRAYHIYLIFIIIIIIILKINLYYFFTFGVMAEWLLRGTVNTLFRGSIPLDAY